LRPDTYNLLNYFANSNVHFGCGQFWKYLKSLHEVYAHFEPNLDPTSDKKMLYTTQERSLRREEAVVRVVARRRACWRGEVQ
jgi:hypothetical protein